MRLSDYKGEEALDVLADIIEPLTFIIADDDIQKLIEESQNKDKKVPMIKYVTPAIKNHKPEIIQILARLQNQSVEEYKESLSLVTLPMQVLEFINDPEIQKFFTSQSQSLGTPSASSGSATENTEAKEN
jgi:ribonuclease D